MIIRVLAELETRAQWMAFLRRETPYCLVEQPATLIDFQSTFLQLTLFDRPQQDPVRYTLGSHQSLAPALELIRRCQWSLSHIVNGLDSLDFSQSVRDTPSFQLPRHLSARRSFARERHLPSPGHSQRLQPLSQLPEQWSKFNLLCLLANRQYSDWHSRHPQLSPEAALNALFNEQWHFRHDAPWLLLLDQNNTLQVRLQPSLNAPPRRLTGQFSER